MRMTCPETYADFGDSRKPRVEPDRALGAVRDVHQLRGAAATDLLAETPGEAFEGALGDQLGALETLRRRADHDETCALLQAADQRREEVAEGHELRRVGESGRVEEETPVAGAGVGGRGGGDAESVQDVGQVLDEPAGASDDDGAVDQRRARDIPVERHGVGQSEVLHQQLAKGRGHEVLVTVRHEVLPLVDLVETLM